MKTKIRPYPKELQYAVMVPWTFWGKFLCHELTSISAFYCLSLLSPKSTDRCVVLLCTVPCGKPSCSKNVFLETGSCSITQAVWKLTVEFRLSQANKCCSYSPELPYLSSTVLSWKYFLCACTLGLRPCECKGQGTALRELALLFLQCGL